MAKKQNQGQNQDPEPKPKRKSKHRRCRSEAEKARHRRAIAHYTALGLNQYEIAEKLGISQAVVSYELKGLREQLSNETMADIETVRNHHVTIIREQIRETIDAWHKSKIDRHGNPQAGNPAHVFALDALLRREASLMGLDAPKKSEISITRGDLREFVNMVFAVIATSPMPVTVEAGAVLESAAPEWLDDVSTRLTLIMEPVEAPQSQNNKT